MNEYNEEIIKIDFNIFIEKKKLFEYNKDDSYIINIKKKYDELINNYSCFSNKYDAKSVWEKKKLKNTKIIHNKKSLPLILSNKNSKNIDINKKNLISNLNKITNNNIDTIIVNIELILDYNYDKINEYFKVVLNSIEKNYDINYIKVLKIFEKKNKDIISNYIDYYKNEKIWMANNYILENNILNDNLYDEYCEYLKWKIKQINILKTIKYFIEEKENYIEILDKIIYDLCEYLLENIKIKSYKYILDYILELLQILSEIKSEEIIKKLKEIDLEKIDKSTKFLILNIIKK